MLDEITDQAQIYKNIQATLVPQFINRQVINASLLFVYKQFLTCASRILESNGNARS